MHRRLRKQMSGRAPRSMRQPARRALLAWVSLLVTAVGTAAPSVPDTPFGEPAPDRGWTEAVISVSSLARTTEFFTMVARWQVVGRGRTDRSLLQHWGLPSSASAREALLCNPGDRSGCVRLIQFAGVPQLQIRSGAQPWETGGVFSLMTRARDLEGAFSRARSLGYGGFSDPIEFEYHGVRLKNVVLRGPDGINVAIYERMAPPLTGWSTIRGLSSPFNAMQTVRDRDRARDFYVRVLGYQALSDAEFLDPAPGPNNFALPSNLVTTVSRRHSILGIDVDGLAGAAGTRQVEMMQFVGVEGRDLAPRAVFPNLGIVALRFPTQRLDRIVASARSGGYAAGGVSSVTLSRWGRVRVCDLRTPDGTIVELLEPVPAAPHAGLIF